MPLICRGIINNSNRIAGSNETFLLSLFRSATISVLRGNRPGRKFSASGQNAPHRAARLEPVKLNSWKRHSGFACSIGLRVVCTSRSKEIISVVGTCRRLKIPLRDYLGSVLAGLGDFPVGRIAELTPTP